MKYLGLGVSSEVSAKINRLVQVKRDRKCWGSKYPSASRSKF